jgi:hypothetical protein
VLLLLLLRRREKTYPQLWADLLEKHDGDAEATLKEYRRIGALAKVIALLLLLVLLLFV